MPLFGGALVPRRPRNRRARTLASVAARPLTLLALLASGCGDDVIPAPGTPDAPVAVSPDDVPAPVPRSGTVVASDAPGAWGEDTFVLNAASIAGDLLTLNLSYGGGCAEHAFTLVASESFLESSPVELAVSLAHRANGDPCEAWLTLDYEFDLTLIRDRYRQTYGTSAGQVVLLLEGVPDGPLVYSFS